MERINTATRFIDKFGPGRDGFADGNPTTGAPSTQLNATWFDNPQEEIANAIELSGMTLNPADMTQLWQAIRSGGGLGPFVRIAGDTMTGPLITPHLVTPNVTIGDDGNSTHIIYNFGDFHQYQWSPGWESSWQISTGMRFWNIPGVGSMRLDAGGSLTVPTNLHANNGLVHIGPGGNGTIMQFSPDWRWDWNVVTGSLHWVGGGTILSTLDGFGNLTIASTLVAGGAVRAGNAVGGDGEFYTDASGGYLRFRGNLIDPAGSQFYQLGIISSGVEPFLSFNTPALPFGGGAWSCTFYGRTIQAESCWAVGFNDLTPSDVNLKTNIVPWNPGVAAIQKINTISFEYLPEAKFGEPGTTYYGIIMQEMQAALPEAVKTSKRHPTDNPEDDIEVLGVETAIVVYACLNAIKEIAARLDALDGGGGTPLPARR